MGFPDSSDSKEYACMQMRKTQIQSLGWQDPLGKGMATHSSFFAWRIPCAEEPNGFHIYIYIYIYIYICK